MWWLGLPLSGCAPGCREATSPRGWGQALNSLPALAFWRYQGNGVHLRELASAEHFACTLKGVGCRGSSGKLSAAPRCHPGTGAKPAERIHSVFLLFSFLSATLRDNLENMKPFFPSWLLSLGYMYPSVSLLLSWGFMYLWAFSFCHLSSSNIHNWIGLFFRWQIRSSFQVKNGNLMIYFVYLSRNMNII